LTTHRSVVPRPETVILVLMCRLGSQADLTGRRPTDTSDPPARATANDRSASSSHRGAPRRGVPHTCHSNSPMVPHSRRLTHSKNRR
jgi:hypothetical protein